MENKLTIGIYRVRAQLLFLLVLLIGTPSGLAQADDQGGLSNLTIDGGIAIRFFFQPPNADFSRPALIFRVASEGDPNWNSAPIDRQGRSAYISIVEMKELIKLLQATDIKWHGSSQHEQIVPFMTLPEARDMTVTAFAPNGTASATIPPKRICEVLAKLSQGITTARAHWEFGFFRRMYHCKVPDFNPYAYVDHY